MRYFHPATVQNVCHGRQGFLGKYFAIRCNDEIVGSRIDEDRI
jgi:hypothetical protein